MEDFIPTNDLDRALVAARRSQSAIPEVYRQLSQGELFLLIPHHPEFEEGDAVQIQNGMEMPFARQADSLGEVVLIFSSEERAQEGMRRGKVPPNKYRIVSMEALQAMEVIGKVGLRALINKSCTTPQFTIPPELMCDIASGEVFKAQPISGKPEVEVALQLLEPADYPTNLVQPVFEVLRQYRNFRAAWIFRNEQAAAEAGLENAFQLLILMDPPDEAIYHELNLVIAASTSNQGIILHGLVDKDDPVYITELFRQAEPFYLAADFAKTKSE